MSAVFSSSIVSKLLTFITFALLARYLTKIDYGNLIVLTGLITALGDLINSGLTAATMRFTSIFFKEEKYEKIGRLISLTIVNTLLLTIFLIGTMVLAADYISLYLFKENFTFLIIISTCGVFTTLIFSNIQSILQGVLDFKGYFIVNTLFGIERVLAIGAMILLGALSLNSAVFLFAFTPLIPILAGFFLIYKRNKIPFVFTYDWKLMTELFNFGKWMNLWALVSVVQSRLDIFLLNSMTTPIEVSSLDVARRFVDIYGLGIGTYLSVMNPRIIAIRDFGELQKELRKFVRVILLLTLLLFFSAIGLPVIMIIVFGSKYTDSIIPLIIMLSSWIFYIWTSIFSAYFNSRGKSYIFFVTALIQLIANVITSLIVLKPLGAVGASVSYFVVNLVGFLLQGGFFFIEYNKEKNEYSKKK